MDFRPTSHNNRRSEQCMREYSQLFEVEEGSRRYYLIRRKKIECAAQAFLRTGKVV